MESLKFLKLVNKGDDFLTNSGNEQFPLTTDEEKMMTTFRHA